MAEGYLRQTALSPFGLRARARADATKSDAGVWIAESGDRGQITLRGDGANAAFQDAVKRATGVAPPTVPNTVAGADRLEDGPRVLWLGPDEWLVVMRAGGEIETMAALRQALQGQHTGVTDTSHGRTVITIAGPRAGDTLLKGCSLDLHPRAFKKGSCAQTTLARASVILHCTGAAYDVYVHRSFAEYLWAWIEDAGAEYGVKVTSG